MKQQHFCRVSVLINVLSDDKVEMNNLLGVVPLSMSGTWKFSGRLLDYSYDPKSHFCSYKIRRIEELGKFNNTLLAAVDSKCNITFVLSVIQGCVLADTIVLFSTWTKVSAYVVCLWRNKTKIKRQKAIYCHEWLLPSANMNALLKLVKTGKCCKVNIYRVKIHFLSTR